MSTAHKKYRDPIESPRPPQGGEGGGEGGEIAIIGLGSNIGKREEQILQAIQRLSDVPGIRLLGISEILETRPVGPKNQPNYINAAVSIRTNLGPIKLLDALQSIEDSMGRKRTVRWGPRIIDLDMLVYGERRIYHSRLIVPHPEIKNRPFVLDSLYELQKRDLAPSPCTLSPCGGEGN